MTRPPADHAPQPELTDGVIVLRPWREEDIEPARLGHDEEIAYWFGFDAVVPSYGQHKKAVERWQAGYRDRSLVGFVIEHDGRPVGSVDVRDKGDQVGELSWTLYAGHRGHGYATRAVRMLVDYAIEQLGIRGVANGRKARRINDAGFTRDIL